MALKKLSRSQKELHAKLLGLTIDHFVGGGIGNAYPQLGGRVIQSRTMEQFVSLGYVKEISRMRMTGSVEKITYEVIDPNSLKEILNSSLKKNGLEAKEIEEPAQHSKLRKAEALEILQGGGFYEEQVDSRYNPSYWMGQLRLNAAWHNDWVNQGIVESYEREYSNGTLRGCKWRMRGFITPQEIK
jgi:hypothetical protein